MKRTKENYYTPQPHFSERAGISGCQGFDGEDVGKRFSLEPFC